MPEPKPFGCFVRSSEQYTTRVLAGHPRLAIQGLLDQSTFAMAGGQHPSCEGLGRDQSMLLAGPLDTQQGALGDQCP